MSKTNPYDGITYIDNETYTAIVDMKERTSKAYQQGRTDAIEEFADWLVKYKMIPDGAMKELIRDYNGENRHV